MGGNVQVGVGGQEVTKSTLGGRGKRLVQPWELVEVDGQLDN